MPIKVQKIWSRLGDLSLIHWLVGFIIIIASSTIYYFRLLKIQNRLAKNLKRKVYFLKTHASKDLQNERDQVREVGIFNIEEDIKDISKSCKVLQNLKDSCVFIVGYYKNYAKYSELINLTKNQKIPVIIFAKHGEIKKQTHWKIFNDYIYCDVANSSNRIVVILLNILMITRRS